MFSHLLFSYPLTKERTILLRNTIVVYPHFSVEAIKQDHMVCFSLVPSAPGHIFWNTGAELVEAVFTPV